MSAYSDECLVLEALNDSHPAFEQLVKQHQHRVLRTIASIITDEQAAKDVAQETFLAAWSDLSKLKEKQKFGRWLNKIAISSSKLWLRDQRKHQDKLVFPAEDVVLRISEPEYQREKLRQEVWDAIDELTEDYREAVILHYISGYSYKEISEILSVSASTVRGRLERARNQLRKEFLDMVTQLQLEYSCTPILLEHLGYYQYSRKGYFWLGFGRVFDGMSWAERWSCPALIDVDLNYRLQMWSGDSP
ncbi:RNA polymerase sigma factor [Candidatus Poribacteria bacterium]